MNSVNLFSLCSFSFRTEKLAAAISLIMTALLERESANFDDSLSGKALEIRWLGAAAYAGAGAGS